MTDFWDEFPAVRNRLKDVASMISAAVKSAGFPLGDELARVSGADGKMLRPGFLMLAAEFGTPGIPDRLIPLAASIEVLHIATLIHDDILDDSPLRRGEAAFHVRNGVKEAILSGDWLFAQAFRLASDFSNPANARELARVIGLICSSEIRQNMDKFRYSRSVREYVRKIAGKTAALFSLSLSLGASEGGCDTGTVERLRRAGYSIGMAFQVIDDILDFEGTEGVFRKPVGKDIAEGLCTLPLIRALFRNELSIAALLRSPPFPADTVSRIAVLVRESGALEDSRQTARLYTSRALREIDALPDCPARLTLRRVAARLLEREY